ncbi:MAG: GNAT family N-acetyltransferase [Cyanobacteria bacterium J06649_4]
MNAALTTTTLAISEVTPADLDEWVAMALLLWPAEEESAEQALLEMRAELEGILQSPRDTALIVRDGDGVAIAFMNLSLCNEYVPGATRFPVAYVEGIYVADCARKSGVGAALMQRAQMWATENDCTQMASDVLIENEESCRFHTRVGFEEVERVVCFIKDVSKQVENQVENS